MIIRPLKRDRILSRIRIELFSKLNNILFILSWKPHNTLSQPISFNILTTSTCFCRFFYYYYYYFRRLLYMFICGAILYMYIFLLIYTYTPICARIYSMTTSRHRLREQLFPDYKPQCAAVESRRATSERHFTFFFIRLNWFSREKQVPQKHNKLFFHIKFSE